MIEPISGSSDGKGGLMNGARKIMWTALLVAGSVTAAWAARTAGAGGDDSNETELAPKERIETFELKNGLGVIVVRDHSLPLVTIEVTVRSGAFAEPPRMNGLSHLYEHMFFKGNREIPNQEAYLKKVRRLGMVFNGETRDESVSYYFSLHKDRLADGLVFMKNALLHPLFDEEELRKEKSVILAEYDRAESQPHFHLQRAVNKALWPKNWSRKDALGDREVIRKATAAQLRWIKQQYYQPSNTALIVAGDVTTSKARRLASEVFGGWKGRPVKLPEVRFPPLEGHQIRFVNQPVRSATVMIALRGPALRKDPSATYAADVLSFAINQRTSSFQKALIRSGLANRVSVFYLTRRAPGPIYVGLTTSPKNVLPAIKAAVEGMQTWDRAETITDQQIAAAKVRLKVQDVYAREKTSSFSHLLGRWWASASISYYLSYVSNLQKVTRADLSGFVRTYIKSKPMVVGVLMSRADQKEVGLTEDALEDVLTAVVGSGGRGKEEGGAEGARPGASGGDRESISPRRSKRGRK